MSWRPSTASGAEAVRYEAVRTRRCGHRAGGLRHHRANPEGRCGAGTGAGIEVGLLRPITLYPFPVRRSASWRAARRAFLVVELSTGQMVEDVRLALKAVSRWSSTAGWEATYLRRKKFSQFVASVDRRRRWKLHV